MSDFSQKSVIKVISYFKRKSRKLKNFSQNPFQHFETFSIYLKKIFSNHKIFMLKHVCCIFFYSVTTIRKGSKNSNKWTHRDEGETISFNDTTNCLYVYLVPSAFVYGTKLLFPQYSNFLTHDDSSAKRSGAWRGEFSRWR